MTEDHRENLSAGMDGELSSEALRFLLRRLDHDTAMRQAWSRYHVIGDGLRHQLPTCAASSSFADRVMRVIESEAGASKAARPRHWMRWSAGGAIAASVAVAALMTTQPAGSPADHAASRLAASGSRPAGMAVASASPRVAPTTSPATVPTWLRDNSGVSLLSERATATLGAPSGNIVSPYASSLQPYQVSSRYRTLNNHDGSYLLLIDTDQKQAANQGDPAQLRAAVH
jgi:sigma-E factor negative regulatory protein RseA